MSQFPMLVIISGFLIAFIGTAIIRRFANRLGLIDAPVERSSHSIPTPRGGGLAFVVPFLMICLLLGYSGYVSMNTVLSVFGAGSIVAMIGFLDDYRGLSVKLRLVAHFIAAAWGLYWLKGLPMLSVFGYSIDFKALEYGLLIIYLVWLLNLYNFMDGIDGIASIEAITVLLGFSLISLLSGYIEVILPVLLAFSVAGFLCWNFPPAKIFMGDIGSGFLGMIIGLLSIQTAVNNPDFFWCWLILLGVFIVDTSVTLIRRILHKQKFYQAHRSHAYQYASRLCRSHKKVSLGIAGINIGFLLPIALLVALNKLPGIDGVLIAYLPLVVIAIFLKAGAADSQAELA